MVQNNHLERGTMANILESLGVEWNRPQISHFYDSNWNFHFRLLVQFRDREGHLRVPRQHVEDGQKLGSWIFTNRAKKKAGKLCPERERQLNEIGSIW